MSGRTSGRNPAADSLIAAYPAAVRELADAARDALATALPGATESVAAFRVRDAERHFATAAKMAQRFPGVEVSTSYGTPAMKVKGKFMARLRTEAEGWLAIKCAFIDREILLQAAPRVFHLTPHYQSYPMVLVDLAAIDEGVLLEVVERAWRTTASEKAVRDWDAQHGSAAAGKPRLRKRRTLRKRAARR